MSTQTLTKKVLSQVVRTAIITALFSLAACGGGVSTSDVPTADMENTDMHRHAKSGAAILSWVAPTTNEDGTPLTTLAGYKIYYGTAPGVYTSSENVGAVNSFRVHGLTRGRTYYFTVTAYDASGSESAYAATVSKRIS